MTIAISNRLLPLLAGIVVLVTVLVLVKSCSDDGGDAHAMTTVPQAPTPDVDTPADTIKTLTANVSAMTAALATLRRDNAALSQKNQQFLNNQRHIEDTITARLEKTLLTQSLNGEKHNALEQEQAASQRAALAARIDALSQRLSTPPSKPSQTTDASDIPVGLGLDELGLDGLIPPMMSDTLIWQKPLEQTTSATASPLKKPARLLQHYEASTVRARKAAPNNRTPATTSSRRLDHSTPVYTIPRNATLIGSTAMTALVGRIPVQGQVRDPMPFKVITGRDNLAANGLSVPGVQGMIWSGTAIGDWTLSCVSGTLESVTFVFDDGTIQTLSSDDKTLQQSGGNQQKPLGWISDARGIPCVSGDRKTNAPAYLSQRLGIKAIEAAAQAAAQAETTTVIADEGTGTRRVTGDIEKFVLGKTLSGGSQEVAQWLQERQAQSFDAVFVPAGIELAIHVDHELPIDFHSNGRKLYYENTFGQPPIPSAQTGTAALD